MLVMLLTPGLFELRLSHESLARRGMGWVKQSRVAHHVMAVDRWQRPGESHEELGERDLAVPAEATSCYL